MHNTRSDPYSLRDPERTENGRPSACLQDATLTTAKQTQRCYYKTRPNTFVAFVTYLNGFESMQDRLFVAIRGLLMASKEQPPIRLHELLRVQSGKATYLLMEPRRQIGTSKSVPSMCHQLPTYFLHAGTGQESLEAFGLIQPRVSEIQL